VVVSGAALKDVSIKLEVGFRNVVMDDAIESCALEGAKETVGLEIGMLVSSDDDIMTELVCCSIGAIAVVLGCGVGTGVLITPLLMLGSGIENVGAGMMGDPPPVETMVITLSLLGVGDVSDSICGLPSAGIDADMRDREGLAVEGAISDTVIDTTVDSSFELVAVTVILDVRASSVVELVIDMMSMTEEETMYFELEPNGRLGSTDVGA
jgi:hypothetical protein